MLIVRRALSTTMSVRRKNSGVDPLDIPSWTDTLKTLHVPLNCLNGNVVHINGNGKGCLAIEGHYLYGKF